MIPRPRQDARSGRAGALGRDSGPCDMGDSGMWDQRPHHLVLKSLNVPGVPTSSGLGRKAAGSPAGRC